MRYPIEITATDRTAQTLGKVENRLGKLGKPSAAWRKDLLGALEPFDALHHSVERIAKPMAALQDAFAMLGKQRGGLGAANTSVSSLSRTLRSAMPSIGDIANDNGLGSAATGVSALGEAAAGTANGLGEAAAGASGLTIAAVGVGAAVGGAVVGLGAAAVAGLNLAAKWDSSAVSLDNLSKNIGISAVQLQAWKAAAEQAGVKADEMATGIGNIRRHANAVRLGQDTTAQAILQNYGINPQTFAGQDFNSQMAAIGQIVRKQRNAQMQAVVAGAFGAESLLPVLRQPQAQTEADKRNYITTGGPLSQAQLDEARKRLRNESRVKQAIGGIGNRLGQLGSNAAAPVWGAGAGGLAAASSLTSMFNYIGKRSAKELGKPHGPPEIGGFTSMFGFLAKRAMGLGQSANTDDTAAVATRVPTFGTRSSQIGLNGSLADRNNNPGNLMRRGRYRTFASLAEGWSAMEDQLLRDFGRGQTTPRSLISDPRHGWSPEGAPGNGSARTSGYMAAVARALGIGIDDPIDMRSPSVVARLMQAMNGFERGGPGNKPNLAAVARGLNLNITFSGLPAGVTATAHGDDHLGPVKIGYSQVGAPRIVHSQVGR